MAHLPWRRILAESLAIIASILIAFAIDAAWDSAQADHELREILEGLRSEAVANQQHSKASQSEQEQALRRLRRFRSGTDEEWERVAPSSFYDEVYLPFVRDWSAPFQTGFLDATISSGKLALISDPAARASLTSLAAELESLDQLLRELSRMAADAAAVIGEYPAIRQVPGGVATDESGLMALRRDIRLQGLASSRIIFIGGYNYTLQENLEPKLREAIALIDESLRSLR